MIKNPSGKNSRTSLNWPFGEQSRIKILIAAALCTCLALGTVACKVDVQKGANGEDKNVKIDTPFGGVHVNTDQTTASDLGLPVYAGAQIVPDKDNDKSADVHLGFGQWELRVKVVNYATPDSQDQVTAFYKKALGRYGDVISCSNNKPVGTPAVTAEGLTCSDDTGAAKVKVNGGGLGAGSDAIELKAGSKRHQYIVGFDDSKDGKTRFALVEVELPSGLANSCKSD